MIRRSVWVVVFLIGLIGTARAESDADLARAKAHFEAGRALYSLGNYGDALREFEAGYQLVPRSQFLLNIGLTYQKLNQLDKAAVFLQRFIDGAPPDDPTVKRAQQVLADVEREQALHPQPATPPPVPPGAPLTLNPPAVPVAPAVSPLTMASPAPSKRGFRRYWWILPVAVVAAAGIGIGIYFAVRPTLDCGSASLGCVDGSGAR